MKKVKMEELNFEQEDYLLEEAKERKLEEEENAQ